MIKVFTIEPEYEALANCYLAVDEQSHEAALVDPGCYLKNAPETVKSSGANVKYIFLTHGHFDHILGVHNAKQALGAQTVINPLDEECLRDRKLNLMHMFGIKAELFPEKADIEAADGLRLKLGDTVFTVMHTPGHTPGGVCFIDNEDRIIFSGDTLFRSTVGRTDNIGGDGEAMCESIKKLLALDGNYTVYPGHGPKTELDTERIHNIYIRRMSK